MKNLYRFVLLSLALCFSALGVPAQTASPTPPPATTGADDPSKTFEVRLPVTIIDKKEKLVGGLKKEDFIVLEDGVPQEITFFTDESNNPPIYVGVLMDTSASTKGKMAFSKQAAKDFIYTVTKVRRDKAAFMTFDHEINLVQDFTDKLDMLDKAVDGIKKTGSQTALYDAVYQFSDEKLRSAPGRRVIVIITDGDDTFSRAVLSDAVDIAQRTETTIFGISTKEAFLGAVPGVEAGTVRDKGDKFLAQLCEATGGEAFFTGNIMELEKAFTRIREELRSQYIITYRPANQSYDGRKRRIEVRLKDKEKEGKLKVRSKTEYRSVRDTLK